MNVTTMPGGDKNAVGTILESLRFIVSLTVVVQFSPPPRSLGCPSFSIWRRRHKRGGVQVSSLKLLGGGTKLNDHGNGGSDILYDDNTSLGRRFRFKVHTF